MIPSAVLTRVGRLTLKQYLGLSEGMSLRVAGRMLTLAGDFTNDIMQLLEDARDPRHDRDALGRLARAAARIETQLAQLLVLAAQHCTEWELSNIPHAIRENMKTVGRCRSSICLRAIAAEQALRDTGLAA